MYMYMIGPLVYFTRATIGFMVAYLYLDGVHRPTRKTWVPRPAIENCTIKHGFTAIKTKSIPLITKSARMIIGWSHEICESG